MILYSLRCAEGHEYDEWFSNSGEYDTRKADGGLVCPECGSTHVEKAIMAPRVAGSSAPEPMPAACMPGGCSRCAG
jgi:hypothetical protein